LFNTRQKELKNLTEVANECFVPHPRRYHERPYLRAVYELYREWLADKRPKTKAKQLATLYKIPWRKDKHPIGMIIDCSAPGADRKMRSKWTQALRFARAKGVPASDLSEFMAEHDGMAGCARGFAKLNRKKKQQTKPIKKQQAPPRTKQRVSGAKKTQQSSGLNRTQQRGSSKGRRGAASQGNQESIRDKASW
jgi:hypothetical protein